MRNCNKYNGKCDKKVICAVTMVIIIASIFAMIAPALGYYRPVPIPPGEEGIHYLSPRDSSVPSGTKEVELHVNSSIGLGFGQVRIKYNLSCVNITGVTFNTTVWDDAIGTGYAYPSPGIVSITYSTLGDDHPPGDYPIANLTIECTGGAGTCCISDLIFIESYITNSSLGPWGADWDVPGENGTVACGEPTEESFSKDLYDGWNLVSLPLTPSDNSTSSVLASVLDNVSAVYRYNATSKQFESASTMDSGIGYFVHVTQNCTWTYSGTPYTSMSTELKQGLNMVGWLNCSKPIDDALSSIDGDYWYVARWNAVSQSFEVYNPVAPPTFNDFDVLERGTGYFISAKADATLSASC